MMLNHSNRPPPQTATTGASKVEQFNPGSSARPTSGMMDLGSMDGSGSTMQLHTMTRDSGDFRFQASFNELIEKAFTTCESDPKGSVHRAWGLLLIFAAVFSIVALVEVFNLQRSHSSSKALVFATFWTLVVQLAMAILGTFILKRFPTSFSIGFFLGLVVILSQQNLILFATYRSYRYGAPRTNHVFANLALALSILYFSFALILAHFREAVLVHASAPPPEFTTSPFAAASQQHRMEPGNPAGSPGAGAAPGGPPPPSSPMYRGALA